MISETLSPVWNDFCRIIIRCITHPMLSIDVPESSHTIPTKIDETFIAKPIPMDISQNLSFTWTYQVVNDSTQRQKHKLFDSSAYSYTVKKKTGNATSWRHTVKHSFHEVFIVLYFGYGYNNVIITLLKRYHRLQEKNICHLIITNHIDSLYFANATIRNPLETLKSATLPEKYR